MRPPPKWHALIKPHVRNKHTVNFTIESVYPIKSRDLGIDTARNDMGVK